MLSILIPTYNYNVYPLAENLQKSALKLGLTFELICMDDGSHANENRLNEKINSLPNCTFIEHNINQGRTASYPTAGCSSSCAYIRPCIYDLVI